MLSTEELKNYVYNEVQTRLGEVSCGNLYFAEGTDNSVEGIYICDMSVSELNHLKKELELQ